jgi:hypothetical protein
VVIGDHATTLSLVELTGHTEANATVTLQQTGAVVQAENTGTFHFFNVALALGANPFTAQATDLAGNASSFAPHSTWLMERLRCHQAR